MSEENPYAPPTAELKQAAPARGSPVKAVLFGFLADNIGTYIASNAIAMVWVLWSVRSGAYPIDPRAMQDDFAVRAATMVFGTAFSIVGGYLCARVAAHREMTLGAIQAAISMVAGYLLSSHSGVWLDVTYASVTAAAILTGSFLGRRVNARRREGS